MRKWGGIAATVVAGAAGIFAAWTFAAAAEARAAVATLHGGQAKLVARITAREAQVQADQARWQEVEADNALLGEALEHALAARAAEPVRPSRAVVEARLKRAESMVREGADPAETLRELLWCWDEGLPGMGGPPPVVQISRTIRAIGALGQTYPEALTLLRERRDALRQSVLEESGSVGGLGDLSSILATLKEPQVMLEIYDQIPAGDTRRVRVGIYASGQLLEARRYAEVLASTSYNNMSRGFEFDAAERPVPTSWKAPDKFRAFERAQLAESTAKNIEILAGAGDLAHARELAQRLFAVNNSPEAQATVQKHLERAGQPGLLTGTGK